MQSIVGGREAATRDAGDRIDLAKQRSRPDGGLQREVAQTLERAIGKRRGALPAAGHGDNDQQIRRCRRLGQRIEAIAASGDVLAVRRLEPALRQGLGVGDGE
jgi:hypothetical protein